MKKRVVERTFAVLMACAVSVGLISCGNDPAEQPAPAPQALTPSEPVARPSELPSPEPPPAAPAAPSPADDFSELERLGKVAQRLDSDFLTPARAWAGAALKRKLWVCDIAQRTGRVTDLVVLARDAQAACSGADATFGNYCRVARHFEAGLSFDEMRKVLEQAIPLADTPERKAYVATLWRRLPPAR